MDQEEYPAYGYFFSHNEKYVLTREAKLWEADSYEHIIFMECQRVDREVIQKAKKIMTDHMESTLVRKGKKYPESNHMYSFLTIVLVANEEINRDEQKLIQKFRFEKTYLCNFRGYSRGRLIGIDLHSQKFYANPCSKILKNTYMACFT